MDCWINGLRRRGGARSTRIQRGEGMAGAEGGLARGNIPVAPDRAEPGGDGGRAFEAGREKNDFAKACSR